MKNSLIKEITLEAKQISGLKTRTNNANEISENAKIGALHQSFNQQIMIDYAQGGMLYGVYHDYQTDHKGDFSVLVGSTENALKSVVELEQVTLVAGTYLVFSARGEMPQTVINTWNEVWAYFSCDTSKHQRAYTTDFECYTSTDSVEVYISIM